MSAADVPKRCRLILIVPPETSSDDVEAALSGGDVASVILPQYGDDDRSFQDRAAAVGRITQDAGAAFIVAGDSRVAGRVGADGIHVEVKPSELSEIVEKAAGRMIVGCGGMKTRHDALEAGEAGPDYLFFGKFGYDTKPQAHPRNLALGQWWAEMVEIPGIVMAGSDLQSVVDVAETNADFVAVAQAVFGSARRPREAVAEINGILDETAPRFED